jgi:hypothetical protein
MQAESSKLHFSGKCGVPASKNSPLFELARVLVRLDQVASVIENANHSMM